MTFENRRCLFQNYNISLKKRNESFLNDLVIVFLFLLFFLRYYKVPILNISFEILILFIVTLLLVLIPLCNHNGRLIFLNKTLPFTLWSIFITIIYYFANDFFGDSDRIHTLLSFLMFSFSICIVSSTKIGFSHFLKIYHSFAYVVLAVYFLQWLLLIFGKRVDFHIPFLNYSNSWIQLKEQVFGMNKYPTSLFNEPAHFCLFLLPLLVLTLIGKSKHSLFMSIVLSLIILSSGSGNGIVCVAIVWIVYLLYSNSAVNFNQRFALFVVAIFAVLVGFMILNSIPRFRDIFSRLFIDTTGSGYSSAKADYRIYRGFELYFKLPFMQKIVGVGYSQMEYFSSLHGIQSMYDRNLAFEYFSMITAMLIYFGFAGFALFFYSFLWMFKLSTKKTRCLLILFIALMFSSAMLLSSSHLFFCVAISYSIQKQPSKVIKEYVRPCFA